MVSHALEIVRCIVPQCENTSISCPEKSFFLLSAEEERCHHWLLVCNREDLLEKATVHDEFAVCSDHFIDDHFENTAHTKLKDNAVPTIFPSSQQTMHFNSQINVVEDSIVFIKSEETPFINYDVINESEQDCQIFENREDIKYMQQLCRLCANVAEEMVYLFNSSGKNMHLAQKINVSLPVTVHDSDPLPKQLCSICVTKVNMCHEFAEMCLLAEEKLLALVRNNAFQAHHIAGNIKNMSGIVASEIGQSFSSITVVEGGSEYNHEKISASENISCKTNNIHCGLSYSDSHLQDNAEIDADFPLFACPLCPEGTVAIKDQEKSIVDDDQSGDEGRNEFSLKFCKQKSSLCTNINRTHNLGINTILKNALSEEIKNECDDSTNEEEKEEWGNSNSAQTQNSLDESGDKDESVSNNSKIIDTTETVCCYMCQESFDTLDLCLNHSKTHFSDGSYPCSICNKIFNNEIEHAHHRKYHAVAAKKFSHNGKRLQCDICERRFNSQRTFFNHSCMNSDTKQYRCNACKRSYSTQERLIFHQKFHEGARPNFCGQCGKEYDNEGALYYHTRMVHEGERPYSCNTCGKKFYSNSRLVAHKRVHTGERPFECEVCGRRFYDRETLKGHYVTHMAVKPFQCDYCGVCWGRKSLLNQHIRTHHSDDSSASRRVPSLIHYYCKICNQTFTNSTDVLMHRTTHWKTNSPDDLDPSAHVCEYCGESFSLITMLVKHRKQKHPDEKPFVCSLCNTCSHTLYEARLHRNTHSLSKEVKTEEMKVEKSSTFICEACGNIFTEKRKFMRHMREHKANHSYKCQVCGKQFIDNQRLTVHMRLHTGEKPYPCHVCGKKFSQTSALYTHALLHTGEKPHSCDLCGKAFRIKADRDNHRRTHTGEKPYKCEFCDKTFRTGQVYYQHRMIHTGERRFPCNICGKAFKRSHTLVVHKRIHTGEKPNICDVCGKGFRQRSDMRKHRALHGTTDQVIF